MVTRVEVRGGRDAVTCPAGAVGTIVQSPSDADHSYRVRLPGGEVVSLRRGEMSVLKHFQRGKLVSSKVG